MIENKSLRSKIFDILNIVILIAITLICIVPVWYVLCVSLSSREAVNAGKVALWPVGFNLLSYKKIMGETAFFGSFLVSIKRVLLGTGISMVCILMAAYPLSRTKKQFPKRDIFMWIFVFCMLFNGGTVPWYITMKNYHLMDNIFGLVRMFITNLKSTLKIRLRAHIFPRTFADLLPLCYDYNTKH